MAMQGRFGGGPRSYWANGGGFNVGLLPQFRGNTGPTPDNTGSTPGGSAGWAGTPATYDNAGDSGSSAGDMGGVGSPAAPVGTEGSLSTSNPGAAASLASGLSAFGNPGAAMAPTAANTPVSFMGANFGFNPVATGINQAISRLGIPGLGFAQAVSNAIASEITQSQTDLGTNTGIDQFSLANQAPVGMNNTVMNMLGPAGVYGGATPIGGTQSIAGNPYGGTVGVNAGSQSMGEAGNVNAPNAFSTSTGGGFRAGALSGISGYSGLPSGTIANTPGTNSNSRTNSDALGIGSSGVGTAAEGTGLSSAESGATFGEGVASTTDEAGGGGGGFGARSGFTGDPGDSEGGGTPPDGTGITTGLTANANAGPGDGGASAAGTGTAGSGSAGGGDAGPGGSGTGPGGQGQKRGGKVIKRPDPKMLADKLKRGSKVTVGDNDDNTDDVPTRLTKGEMVVNKKATQKFEPLLNKMNMAGNRAGGMRIGRK